MLKILVVGSNGFIGKNIVEAFENNSEYLVLKPRRAELNLLDTGVVNEYMKANKPDVVIQSAVNIHSLHDNIRMYFNVRRCSGYYGKSIVIGSGAEYDMKHYYPKMEESYFNTYVPDDIYGLSKYVIANDVENSRDNAVNLRVFGIFGRYEDYRRRFISNNICRAMCGYDILINQNMKFDYLYVDDFLKILELFINRPLGYRSYNICAKSTVELLLLARMIQEIHGDDNVRVSVKNEGMKPEYSGSNGRFVGEFGSFNYTDMKVAVRELYDWYKNSVDLSEYLKELDAAEGGT